LDAGGSSDNVAIVSWEWTFDDDGAQSLPDETATYTFENAGVFTVTLTVEDAALNSDTDTVVITVIDTEAPFADAGEDVSVVVGGTVTLNGTGSSDNVGIASYTWTFTDVASQILPGAEPEYTFENEGDFTIMLTVVDDEGLSDTDEVVVHVLPENAAPTADAGDDQIITEGDTVTLDGTGSTDDGGAEALNYTWTFEYDGETVTRYGAEVEFTFEIPGEYDVTLTVEDEDGLTSTDSVTITVEETSATFIEQYWWALAALAAVIVVAAAVVLFMKKGKGGAPSKKAPKKDEDADDEMEDEDEPPAPPEEEEL
jgi:PKD repeat protein